jgi:hypothetical protein
MTPLSPEERQAIVDAHPSAAPGEIEADIDEYERLVAEMFSRDPSAEAISVTPSAAPALSRLNQLHTKLFG